MTVNRKIDKTFLKEIFKERNQNNLVSAADYNNLSDDEVQILKLVSKKLNISITKLDISKDFFENGGDSLSLFTFILDLEDYYGVSIPMDDIYGKKLYDLIRELKGNIKRKLHVEKTDNLLDMRNEDFYSKTEIKFLYDSYLRNTNKVISKFQAIHCQRIYYYDNYRNILTSTFEYKNCSIEKIKSVVQQVRLFVNCSGLMKSYNLERTKLVLSFLMFKAMRILVLKLSKFRKPKAFRLMTLMRLLVASSFAFEYGSSIAFMILSISFKKVLKTV